MGTQKVSTPLLREKQDMTTRLLRISHGLNGKSKRPEHDADDISGSAESGI